MSIFETFGRPRSITQPYEEDGDKMFLKHIETMMPDEVLLVPFNVWEQMMDNHTLRHGYFVEWNFDNSNGFGCMKMTNLRGWELKAYTHPEVQFMQVRELDDALKLELSVAAL